MTQTKPTNFNSISSVVPINLKPSRLSVGEMRSTRRRIEKHLIPSSFGVNQDESRRAVGDAKPPKMLQGIPPVSKLSKASKLYQSSATSKDKSKEINFSRKTTTEKWMGRRRRIEVNISILNV
jgi:hypothetical protein